MARRYRQEHLLKRKDFTGTFDRYLHRHNELIASSHLPDVLRKYPVCHLPGHCRSRQRLSLTLSCHRGLAALVAHFRLVLAGAFYRTMGS
jgi:hypothetical protein